MVTKLALTWAAQRDTHSLTKLHILDLCRQSSHPILTKSGACGPLGLAEGLSSPGASGQACATGKQVCPPQEVNILPGVLNNVQCLKQKHRILKALKCPHSHLKEKITSVTMCC